MLDNPLALIGLCAAAVVVGFLILYAAALRLFRPITPRRDREEDLANTRILFQTMRDLLEQQKSVARRLNQSFDDKVRHIQEVVDSATARMDELEKRVAKLNGAIKTAGDASQPPSGEEDASPREPQLSLFTPASVAEDALQPNEEPKQESGTPEENAGEAFPPPPRPSEDEIIASWEGFDFAVEEPPGDAEEPEEPEAPPEAPAEPEDAESAREAFRALLDLEVSETEPVSNDQHAAGPDRASRPENAAEADSQEATSGEEPPPPAGHPTPLQARVYSYADAGMTPPQVAKELGIGKGEVMLILGLRKEREG